MAGKHTSVFGILNDRAAAERGVDALRSAGFASDDISTLMPDRQCTRGSLTEHSTKAPEGATAGGSAGVILGSAFGWLVGIGTLAIPGVGPFIAAGPIMAALAGAGIGGALGGIAGALVGMGIPEYDAKRYEGMIRTGGILLSVDVSSPAGARRARQILEAGGAENIASAGAGPGDADDGEGDRRADERRYEMPPADAGMSRVSLKPRDLTF